MRIKATTAAPRPRPHHRIAVLCLLISAAVSVAGREPVVGDINLRSSPTGWSLQTNQAELHQILDRLAQQTNMEVISHVALDKKVTLVIKDLSLPMAVSRLLQDYSFALRYSAPEVMNTDINSDSHNRLVIFTSPFARATAVESEHTLYIHGQGYLQWQLELYHGNEADRIAALVSLSELEADIASDAILLAMQDPAANVRAEAVALLGETGDSSTIPFLIQAIDDSDKRVQRSALLALSDIGGQEARHSLQKALKHPAPHVRHLAAEQLTAFEH